MQVLVRKTEGKGDVQCGICGQGFRLYWERTASSEQVGMDATIRETLHRQHMELTDHTAHPVIPFNVPSWPGMPQFSAAALLGGLSSVRRVPALTRPSAGQL